MMQKYVLLITLSLLLFGCERPDTYTHSYLVNHPGLLKKRLDQCERQTEKTAQQASQCEIVLSVAAHFSALLNEQQEDPQQFGQRILTAERVCVQTQDELQTIKQSLQVLSAKQTPAAALTAQEKRRDNLQSLYQTCHQEVELLLAVVGLNSPE